MATKKASKKKVSRKKVSKKRTSKKRVTKKRATKMPAKKNGRKKVAKKAAKKAAKKVEPPSTKAEIERERKAANEKLEAKMKGPTKLGTLQMLKLNPEHIVVVDGINPRIDTKDIHELMASIKKNGQKEPISVRKVGKHYELVHGERRLRAILKLGLKSINAIEERGKKTDAELIALHLVHNDGKPLAPVEEADAFRKLINLGWTQKQIAIATGKRLRLVKDRLQLISSHPDVVAAVKSGKLSLAVGTAIAKKAKGKKRTQARMVKKATATKAGKKKVAAQVGKASLKTKLERAKIDVMNKANECIHEINKVVKKRDKLPTNEVDQVRYFGKHDDPVVRAAFLAGGVHALSFVGVTPRKTTRKKKKVTARAKQGKGKKRA